MRQAQLDNGNSTPKKARVHARVRSKYGAFSRSRKSLHSRTIWHQKTTRRIAAYLMGRGELGDSPKNVAKVTKIKLRTVYNILEELGAEGTIIKDGYLWRSKDSIPELTTFPPAWFGTHGHSFVCYDYPVMQKGGQGPPLSDDQPNPAPVGSFGHWKRNERNRDGKVSYQFTTEYLRRRVLFRWWPSTRTIIIYLKTTLNPLSMEETIQLNGFWAAKFAPVDHNQYLEVLTTSANIDYRTVTMEGMNHLMWRNYLGDTIGAYNKAGRGLRVEAEHKVERGAERIPWPRMFEALLTLDPRVQEARANLALSKAIERYTEAVKDLEQKVDSISKPKGPEKYSPPPPEKEYDGRSYG